MADSRESGVTVKAPNTSSEIGMRNASFSVGLKHDFQQVQARPRVRQPPIGGGAQSPRDVKVPNDQEIPMSKITWLNPCDSNARRCPQSAPLSGRQDQVSARPAWTVTATAKRRRREAGLDKRLRARVREKSPLGVKNTFLDPTSRKK